LLIDENIPDPPRIVVARTAATDPQVADGAIELIDAAECRRASFSDSPVTMRSLSYSPRLHSSHAGKHSELIGTR
jgi:hypothetical protein